MALAVQVRANVMQALAFLDAERGATAAPHWSHNEPALLQRRPSPLRSCDAIVTSAWSYLSRPPIPQDRLELKPAAV